MPIVFDCSRRSRGKSEAVFVLRRRGDILAAHISTLMDYRRNRAVSLILVQADMGSDDFIVHFNRYGQVSAIPVWFIDKLRSHLPSVEFFYHESASLMKWRLRLSLSDLVMLRLMEH